MTTTICGTTMPAVGNIKVALAEDYAVIRRGINNLLTESTQLKLYCSSENGLALIECLKAEAHAPDVVLLDVVMPVLDGFETATQIRLLYPDTRILYLTSQLSSDFLDEVLQTGGHGFVIKDTDLELLNEAIVQVYSKGFYFAPDTDRRIMRRFVESGCIVPQFPEKELLTANDFSFIRTWAAEPSDHITARKTGMSFLDVQLLKAQIMKKLAITNEAELTVFAIFEGLV